MIQPTNNLKFLQADTQTFKKLIEGNFIYVDKTKHIYDMINKRTACFISRPRRFGKSLTCSTLEQIFLGNKELFKGLFIYDSDYEWKKHPVIKIDMSSVDATKPDEFRYELTTRLLSIAKKLNIETGELRTPSSIFETMIEELSKQGKVVIIIDEYDSPILTQITNPSAATDVRETLRSFYKILKSQDENIRFTFVTGVSKFSKTSFFSGANHLKNLTMLPSYADMLGYTQKELEHYFKDYIDIAAQNMNQTPQQQLEELRKWYNGYRFSKKEVNVYNPFSVSSHLDNVANDELDIFKNYWFESGSPTFLYRLLKEKNINSIPEIPEKATEEELSRFDIEKIQIKVLLYQTGYLTISDYEIISDKDDDDDEIELYTLNYPNKETRKAFVEGLVESVTKIDHSNLVIAARAMAKSLRKNNVEEFINATYQLFTNIPYPTQDSKKEETYQRTIYLVMSMLGIRIQTEVSTNIGRIDAAIMTNTHVYIFEFKINSDAKNAIDQIKEKRYYEKYQQDKKEIVLVGINFDTTLRNIEDWIVEKI